jgi:hypothetical protein
MDIVVTESVVPSEQMEMRISNSGRCRVHMQARLIRSPEVAVQKRYQQLRRHDQQQQCAPQRKSLDCTRHVINCTAAI